MSDRNNLDKKFLQGLSHNRRALIIELLCTLGIAVIVFAISLSNLLN